MPLISADSFARACRAADREAVTGLVEALYKARGRTVDRCGEGELQLTAADRTSQRVVVHDGSRSLTADVDVVVSVARGSLTRDSIRVVDVDDLHERLCYAVDTETSARLLEEHLDVSTISPNTTGGDDDSADEKHDRAVGTPADALVPAAEDSETPHRRKRVAFATLAGVICLFALLLAGLALVDDESPTAVESNSSDAMNVTAAATPTPRIAEQSGANSSFDSPGTSWVPGQQWPPGVNKTAVDPPQLLAAHVATLDNNSYTMTLTYREFRDGAVRNGYAETVRVSNDSRAEATVSTFGSLQTKPWRLLGEQRTAVRYVQNSEVDSPGALVQRNATRHLQRALSATGTRLVDHNVSRGVTTTQISLRNSPEPSVQNASGSAFATQDGIVRFLRWQFDHGDMRVVVTFHVMAIGETKLTGSRLGVDLSECDWNCPAIGEE